MDKLFAAISLFVASLLFPQTPIRTQHRSVLLDCGRKYYTRDWILDLLEEMEDCHANELVLHFSDDMGLRLESKTYPWLAGSDNAWSLDPSVPDPDPGKVLTQEDILVIGRAASDRGIELIPSFDSPGHMRYILERYREQTGQDIAMSFAPSCLDITNAKGVRFVRSLMEEYGRLFARTGSRQFDIGGDEVFPNELWPKAGSWQAWAQKETDNVQCSPYDGFVLYMNGTDDFVRSLGYEQTRMYSDMVRESTLQLNARIDVSYWMLGRATPVEIQERHRVINCINFYLYYILDPHLSYPGGYADAIEREWTPQWFLGWPSRSDRVTGSCYCIWSDIPGSQTQEQVMEGVRPRLQAWGRKNGFLTPEGSEPR